MDLTPEEQKALTPPLTSSLVLIVAGLAGMLLWAAVDALTLGVVGAAIGGFAGWIGGAKEPRALALSTAQLFAGLTGVLSILVRIARAKIAYDDQKGKF